MTQDQAANIHAKWKQDGERICEHPIQEWVRLARSDDGVLLGSYHCRECGEAIIYIDRSPPFSKSDSTPSFLLIAARCVRIVKTGLRTMLFGQLPRGSMPKQGEDHNDGPPASVAEKP
ncbi:MAG: hypothetical protein ABIO96_06610 [Nitrospiraceae bacterium]